MCQSATFPASDFFDRLIAEADDAQNAYLESCFPHGECNNCGAALESDGTCVSCIEREVALARFGAECDRLGVIPEPEEVALAFG